MDVSKKECVVCHKPLTEHDDVVFCPECGAPYHRECYEKEGHCVFEEKHGSFSYESPKPKYTEEHAQGARCPNCGAENPQNNIFCQHCGCSMRGKPYTMPGAAPGFAPPPPPMPVQGEIDGISVQDWTDFIGDAAPSYLYQFQRMDQKRSKMGLCWISLLFPPAYFFYRKMWAWAAFTMVLSLVTSIPTLIQMVTTAGAVLPAWVNMQTVNTLGEVCFYLNWIMSVLFLVFSTYLYRRFAAGQIKKIRQSVTEPGAVRSALLRRGGTIVIGVVVRVAILFVFSSIFVAWAGPVNMLNTF